MEHIFFDGEQVAKWKDIYSGVNVLQELAKMTAWLAANPKRGKKNYHRFAVNWLTRAHNQLLEAEVRENVRQQYVRREAQIGKY